MLGPLDLWSWTSDDAITSAPPVEATPGGALRTVIGGRKPRRAEPTMQDRAREAGMLSPARQAAWIAAQTVRDVPPGMTQELATILFAAMEFVDE